MTPQQQLQATAVLPGTTRPPWAKSNDTEMKGITAMMQTKGRFRGTLMNGTIEAKDQRIRS